MKVIFSMLNNDSVINNLFVLIRKVMFFVESIILVLVHKLQRCI